MQKNSIVAMTALIATLRPIRDLCPTCSASHRMSSWSGARRTVHALVQMALLVSQPPAAIGLLLDSHLGPSPSRTASAFPVAQNTKASPQNGGTLARSLSIESRSCFSSVTRNNLHREHLLNAAARLFHLVLLLRQKCHALCKPRNAAAVGIVADARHRDTGHDRVCAVKLL